LYRLYTLMAKFRLFSSAMFILTKIRKMAGEGKEKRENKNEKREK
jgi:hypothetical protein